MLCGSFCVSICLSKACEIAPVGLSKRQAFVSTHFTVPMCFTQRFASEVSTLRKRPWPSVYLPGVVSALSHAGVSIDIFPAATWSKSQAHRRSKERQQTCPKQTARRAPRSLRWIPL